MSLVQVGASFYRRSETGIDWYEVDSGSNWLTWQQLCDRMHPEKSIIYLPDPLAGATKLPWRWGGNRFGIDVGHDGVVNVRIGTNVATFDGLPLREAGLALLRAAAQQEANS